MLGQRCLADFVNCQGTISAGSGTINLNGGVAVSGTGNVNLGGGTLGVNDALSGITGGSLVATSESIGTGAPTQSGGTNNPAYLYLGTNAGFSGSYILSASGLLTAYMEYVGCSGTGTFTQSGGTNTVTGSLALGASGDYNLNGGVLLASGIQGAGVFNLGGGTLAASSAFSTSQAMTLTGSGGNGTIDTGGCQCARFRRVIGRLRPLLARAALVVPWLSGHARGRIGWSRRSDRIGCRHADPDRQRHLLGSHDCQQRSSGRRRIAGQPRYGRQWRQAWRDRQLDERDRQRGRVPGAGRCPGDLRASTAT